MVTNRTAYIATYWLLDMEYGRTKLDDISCIAFSMGPSPNGRGVDQAMPCDWDLLNRSSEMTVEESYAAALSFLSLMANLWHSEALREFVVRMRDACNDSHSEMWSNWLKALEWAMEGKAVKFFLPGNDERDIFWRPNLDGSVTLTVVVKGVPRDGKTVAGPW